MLGLIQAGCGNGFLDAGEQCDLGSQNGVTCSVSIYNGQCTFCTDQCLIATLYGPYCGDNSRNGNEQCDDGNKLSGDGCSSTCTFENVNLCGNGVKDVGEGCDNGAQNGVVCTPNYGTYCGYCTLNCEIRRPYGPYCGDGSIQGQYEQCDDGNKLSGDGCSSLCTIENSQPVCGNGVKEVGEQCDDGNKINGDGCSSTCQTETPLPSCGNNKTETGEQCDYGSLLNGILCNAGYNQFCNYCSSTCQLLNLKGPYCGDDIVQSQHEQCDDGRDNGVRCDNSDSSCEYCSKSCKVVELSKDDNNDDDDDHYRIRTLSNLNICNPIWQCTNWGECIDGVQYRTCNDINTCKIPLNKPSEQMGCEVQNTIGLEQKEKKGFNWLWVLLGVLILIILVIIILIRVLR